MLHIKKVKPLFNNIITTGNKFEKDVVEKGVITAKKGDLKLWQKVLAVGSVVRDIKVGDMVMINPKGYEERKYDKNSLQNDMDNNPVLRYSFNWITIDDDKGNPQNCLFLFDRDILYVFEGEEKAESIIMPDKQKLIVN